MVEDSSCIRSQVLSRGPLGDSYFPRAESLKASSQVGKEFFCFSLFPILAFTVRPVQGSDSSLSVFILIPSPTKELHRKLSSDEMYLVDSGGQYWYVHSIIPWPSSQLRHSGLPGAA